MYFARTQEFSDEGVGHGGESAILIPLATVIILVCLKMNISAYNHVAAESAGMRGALLIELEEPDTGERLETEQRIKKTVAGSTLMLSDPEVEIIEDSHSTSIRITARKIHGRFRFWVHRKNSTGQNNFLPVLRPISSGLSTRFQIRSAQFRGKMKMGYTTERLNNRKFLVTRQEPGEAESYQISMLSHNSIAPLLEFSVRSVDNSGYYYYDITGLQNLNSLGGDVLVSPDPVLILCRALAELSDSMNEYFLDIDRVRTDPEHVFGTPALDRFLFLYDPDKSVSEDLYQDGLRKLFEFVLQHFDHTADRDDTVMVYDMYSRILKGTFDPAAYGRIQEEEPEEYEKTSKEQETREADIPQTAASSEDDGAVLPEPERKKNRKKKKKKKKKKKNGCQKEK